MEIMLLTIALLYFVWSIAVLVFDADIWLRNKLRIEKNKVEPKESPPIPADDFIVRHTYTVSPKKVPSEPVQIKQEDEGETIRENEVTFEEDQSSMKSARIPDNKLDEVFTDTRIEDVDVKYDESEEEPVVEQANIENEYVVHHYNQHPEPIEPEYELPNEDSEELVIYDVKKHWMALFWPIFLTPVFFLYFWFIFLLILCLLLSLNIIFIYFYLALYYLVLVF